MITRTLMAAACAAIVVPATAQLLVYEPFDYADGALNGNGGALGTTGTWSTTDTGHAPGWWNHPGGSTTGQVWDPGPDTINDGVDDLRNIYNGIYSNIASTGGFAGSPAPADRGVNEWLDQGTGNMDGYIMLDASVTASFQSNTTTWFSYVTGRAWDRNEGTPQVMLTSAFSSGGSRGLTLNGGDGIGAGGGPGRFNLQDIYPQYFEAGVNNHAPGGFDYPENPYNGSNWNGSSFGQGTLGTNDGKQIAFGSGNDVTARGTLEHGTQATPSARLDGNGDFGDYNVVVMKIQWDADTGGEDIISVVAFGSGDAINEAAFDAAIAANPQFSSANWVGKNNETVTSVFDGLDYQITYGDNKPDLDQSTFTMINIQSLKFYIDEIRLGGTFGDVAPAAAGIPGDTDGDGDIDDADLGTAFANYTGPVGAAGGKTAADGDTDGDGDVDDSDLGTAFSGYTGPLGPASVPEPTSLALIGLGGLALIRRRRA